MLAPLLLTGAGLWLTNARASLRSGLLERTGGPFKLTRVLL
jgi:hypothetical protein